MSACGVPCLAESSRLMPKERVLLQNLQSHPVCREENVTRNISPLGNAVHFARELAWYTKQETACSSAVPTSWVRHVCIGLVPRTKRLPFLKLQRLGWFGVGTFCATTSSIFSLLTQSSVAGSRWMAWASWQPAWRHRHPQFLWCRAPRECWPLASTRPVGEDGNATCTE